MRTLSLDNGHTVACLLSIHEITAGRLNEFQHYQTLDVGVGADSSAVERHLANLAARLGAAQADPEQLAHAADELAHLHYCLHFMRVRYNPRQLSFGVLVAAVDGQPVNDLTEEGLTALLARLSEYGLTQGQIEDVLTEFLKKKPVN